MAEHTDQGLARNTDPDTSHSAARSVDATQIEAVVLAAIRQFPGGCIVDDIEDSLPHLRLVTISPRIKPLRQKGFVVYTGERRKGRSGRGQQVVIAADYTNGATERRENLR